MEVTQGQDEPNITAPGLTSNPVASARASEEAFPPSDASTK